MYMLQAYLSIESDNQSVLTTLALDDIDLQTVKQCRARFVKQSLNACNMFCTTVETDSREVLLLWHTCRWHS